MPCPLKVMTLTLAWLMNRVHLDACALVRPQRVPGRLVGPRTEVRAVVAARIASGGAGDRVVGAVAVNGQSSDHEIVQGFAVLGGRQHGLVLALVVRQPQGRALAGIGWREPQPGFQPQRLRVRSIALN
jgi:hypothetical protein